MVWSDLRSSGEKLDYFGNLDQVGAAWFGRITEVARKNSITSVNWSSRSSTVASDRIKPEGIQNKAGKHSDECRNVTSKYTDLDCRLRHSLI